jgi:hypothetical protein
VSSSGDGGRGAVVMEGLLLVELRIGVHLNQNKKKQPSKAHLVIFSLFFFHLEKRVFAAMKFSHVLFEKACSINLVLGLLQWTWKSLDTFVFSNLLVCFLAI